MATEKWGSPSAYADAFSTATLNSIANGNAILSDLTLDNSAGTNIFMDLSFAFGSITWAAPNFIGLYLYPLNKDGSTYGANNFGSAAAGPPPSNYAIGVIGFPTGAAASQGVVSRIIIPPRQFKIVLWNQSGASLAASGNTLQYSWYSRIIV